MVQDDEPVGLDGLRVCFDDERVVCDAGVMVVATLAARLGIEALAGGLVRLRRDRPGAANAGRKVMALLFAMVLGADSIDDAGVLRAGRTHALVQRDLALLFLLARPDVHRVVLEVDVLAVEREGLAGTHPGDRQQPDHGHVPRGA